MLKYFYFGGSTENKNMFFYLGVFSYHPFNTYKAKSMDELLMKYIKGDVSYEEQNLVVKWLNEDLSHMHQYQSMRKLYTISLWSVRDDENQHETINTVKKEKIHIRSYIYEFLKIASVLLVGIFGTYMYLNTQDSKVNMQSVFVPAGQRAEMILADGTKVWLNSHSTLRYPDRFQKEARNVELDGEGYFEVTHNEKAPFTVHTNSYDVKVLGTEFNLKAYKNSNQFETSLLKGSVDVVDLAYAKSVRLKPKEMVYQKNGELVKKEIVNKNYFHWKEGIFCFDDETIGSLIKKLELYYDVKIIVKKPSLMKYKYSGKFRITDGVEHILKVLQLKHKFTYTRNEVGDILTIE